MKTHVSLSFVLIWITSTTVTIAQTAVGRNVADHLLIREAKKNLGTEEADERVEGSPYLTDTFSEGKIFFNKGNPSIAVPIRYNIYEDWLEYQQNNQTYIIDPSERIKKVVTGNHTLVVEKYQHKGKPKLGYFTLLDSGKIILLSKKVISYKAPQEAKALQEPTPAKYSRPADQYYYKVENDEVRKVENLKEMIASLPANNAELTEFAKKEKISPRKEEELLKLVRYFNELK